MNDNAPDNPTVEDATTEPPANPPGDIGDSADGRDDRGGNREAAKYRTKLREAEAQRDTLSGRLEALQRREAERLAAARLADGADLWRGDGVELAALLDDDGNLDPAKVSEHAAATLESHPHWKRPRVPRQPKRGDLRSGAVGEDYHRPATWSDLLNDRKGDT